MRPRKEADPQSVIDAQAAEIRRLKRLLAARSLPDGQLAQRPKGVTVKTGPLSSEVSLPAAPEWHYTEERFGHPSPAPKPSARKK